MKKTVLALSIIAGNCLGMNVDPRISCNPILENAECEEDQLNQIYEIKYKLEKLKEKSSQKNTIHLIDKYLSTVNTLINQIEQSDYSQQSHNYDIPAVQSFLKKFREIFVYIK